ncbi:MAG TPA: NUDIX domain-containing protein [archaeon]|nr:NUDIX domain-containing protein [archaeon]
MDQAKVAVNMLVLKNGKALFLKRKGGSGDKMWCMPGGHLEFREELAKGAIREVKEEANIKVKNVRFLCVSEDIYTKKHYVSVFFAADHTSGIAHITEKDRFYELGWFSLEKPPKPLFGGTKNVMAGKCFPSDWKNRLKKKH